MLHGLRVHFEYSIDETLCSSDRLQDVGVRVDVCGITVRLELLRQLDYSQHEFTNQQYDRRLISAAPFLHIRPTLRPGFIGKG